MSRQRGEPFDRTAKAIMLSEFYHNLYTNAARSRALARRINEDPDRIKRFLDRRRDILQEIERHIVRDVSTVYGVTITGPPWWGRETGDRAGLKKYNDARDAARAVFPKLTDLALSLLRRHVLDNMAYDSAEGRARIRKFARTIATRAKEQNPRDARLQFA